MISFLKHSLEIEIGYNVFNFLVIQNLNYRASFLDYVVNFDWCVQGPLYDLPYIDYFNGPLISILL